MKTTDGKTIESNLNIWATSFKNNLDYLSLDLQRSIHITANHNIKTNDYLQVSNMSNIYAVGDLIELSTIKSAGWAFHTGFKLELMFIISYLINLCNCQEYPSSK